jgi:hypothetical protein
MRRREFGGDFIGEMGNGKGTLMLCDQNIKIKRCDGASIDYELPLIKSNNSVDHQKIL